MGFKLPFKAIRHYVIGNVGVISRKLLFITGGEDLEHPGEAGEKGDDMRCKFAQNIVKIL